MASQLSDGEQNDLAVDLMINHQSYSEDEFNERYDQLNAAHQAQVNDDIRQFANDAVGDDHWDDD